MRTTRKRPSKTCLALLLLGLVTGQAYAGDEDVWAVLKQPGHLALLRHANAPGATPEPYDINLKDCSIQRSLDDAGRAQARRFGDEFRKHCIKSAMVVSSQFCRAIETGKLLKLGPVRELPALNQVFAPDLGRLQDATGEAKAFIRGIPPNQRTVMISHVTNILGIAGVDLSSGELVVVHLDASGGATADGRIKVP